MGGRSRHHLCALPLHWLLTLHPGLVMGSPLLPQHLPPWTSRSSVGTIEEFLEWSCSNPFWRWPSELWNHCLACSYVSFCRFICFLSVEAYWRSLNEDSFLKPIFPTCTRKTHNKTSLPCRRTLSLMPLKKKKMYSHEKRSNSRMTSMRIKLVHSQWRQSLYITMSKNRQHNFLKGRTQELNWKEKQKYETHKINTKYNTLDGNSSFVLLLWDRSHNFTQRHRAVRLNIGCLVKYEFLTTSK